MLGYNLAVPGVRQALFSRSLDNDDLMPKLRKPVLVVHGAKDAIVRPSVVDQHAASLAQAQVCVMPNVGTRPSGGPAHLQPAAAAFCASL